MCFKFFKKKQTVTSNDKKIRISSPFDFEKYPELFFEYLNYKNAVSKIYKLSVMDGNGLDVANKYIEADKKRESKQKLLAKIVFEVFNPIAPTIENADNDFEKTNWIDVFKNKNFESLDKYQISVLIGLIECNYIYVLPKNYYIKNANKTNENFQFVSVNKMKQLLENKK